VTARFADAERLRHQVEARQAALDRLRHDQARYRRAVEEDAIPRQQLQNTEDLIRETEALIEQARAELAGVEATLDGTTPETHPAVAEAAASLRQKFLDYSRREIVAPVAGHVAKRKVQVGDRVEPGAPLLAIVPLDQLWVEANLKEKDLARVRPGQEAEVIVDMLGGRQPYRGRVEGIHPGTGSLFALLPPENTSGNFIHISERVPVRIALSAKELKERPLRQGLSTFTRIHVRDNGRPPLQSDVDIRRPGYRTDVFEAETRAADRQIRDIIRANLSRKPPSSARNTP
jgi:membrane fusion protein (multidrug efflux system)